MVLPTFGGIPFRVRPYPDDITHTMTKNRKLIVKSQLYATSRILYGKVLNRVVHGNTNRIIPYIYKCVIRILQDLCVTFPKLLREHEHTHRR